MKGYAQKSKILEGFEARNGIFEYLTLNIMTFVGIPWSYWRGRQRYSLNKPFILVTNVMSTCWMTMQQVILRFCAALLVQWRPSRSVVLKGGADDFSGHTHSVDSAQGKDLFNISCDFINVRINRWTNSHFEQCKLIRPPFHSVRHYLIDTSWQPMPLVVSHCPKIRCKSSA